MHYTWTDDSVQNHTGPLGGRASNVTPPLLPLAHHQLINNHRRLLAAAVSYVNPMSIHITPAAWRWSTAPRGVVVVRMWWLGVPPVLIGHGPTAVAVVMAVWHWVLIATDASLIALATTDIVIVSPTTTIPVSLAHRPYLYHWHIDYTCIISTQTSQPPTFGLHYSQFHPYRFTFTGVIAECAKAFLLPQSIWMIRLEYIWGDFLEFYSLSINKKEFIYPHTHTQTHRHTNRETAHPSSHGSLVRRPKYSSSLPRPTSDINHFDTEHSTNTHTPQSTETWYGDGADNITEDNSSILFLISTHGTETVPTSLLRITAASSS